MTERRRARRAATFPEDQAMFRREVYQQWTNSARARGDYRPPRKDPFMTEPKPCVFCKENWDNLDIVERPTESFAIINPLDPVTPGHVLVICSRHSASADADPYIAGDLMLLAAGYVARRGIQANIITSIGANATQTVKHTHVHVVPRAANDGLPLPWTPQHELKRLRAIQALQQIAQESGTRDHGSTGLFQQQPALKTDVIRIREDVYWPTALAEGLNYDQS